MAKIPEALKKTVGANIAFLRKKKFPGFGGAQICAAEFGVSPQQWSPWERGSRMPNEDRMQSIAEFFGVTVAWIREDHGNGDRENYPNNIGKGENSFVICIELPERDETIKWTYNASCEVAAVVYEFCKKHAGIDYALVGELLCARSTSERRSM